MFASLEDYSELLVDAAQAAGAAALGVLIAGIDFGSVALGSKTIG